MTLDQINKAKSIVKMLEDMIVEAEDAVRTLEDMINE